MCLCVEALSFVEVISGTVVAFNHSSVPTCPQMFIYRAVQWFERHKFKVSLPLTSCAFMVYFLFTLYNYVSDFDLGNKPQCILSSSNAFLV